MAFVCGYTSKIPGTEVGVEEPQACFSTCFGEPFIVHPPQVYGELLKQKILKYHVQVWLVNTGWVGGGYGVGSRIPIQYSRAIIHAIQKGHIGDYHTFPYFEYKIPHYCEGVPAELLDPRSSWQDTHAYDSQLQKLWKKFQQAYLEKTQG
jgi:phosphoenolpyruvate carboxykinase (ATP)